MLFTWNEEYGLGIEEIDLQHKRYFDICNRLDDARRREPPDGKEIMAALDELGDYARYHFETEEKHFVEFDFKGAAEHKTLHDAYRKIMKDYLEKAHAPGADLGALAKTVAHYAVTWLVGHIMVADRSYVENFRTHGLK